MRWGKSKDGWVYVPDSSLTSFLISLPSSFFKLEFFFFFMEKTENEREKKFFSFKLCVGSVEM